MTADSPRSGAGRRISAKNKRTDASQQVQASVDLERDASVVLNSNPNECAPLTSRKHAEAAEADKGRTPFIRAELEANSLRFEAVLDTAASHCFITPDAARASKAQTQRYESPVQLG